MLTIIDEHGENYIAQNANLPEAPYSSMSHLLNIATGKVRHRPKHHEAASEAALLIKLCACGNRQQQKREILHVFTIIPCFWITTEVKSSTPPRRITAQAVEFATTYI